MVEVEKLSEAEIIRRVILGEKSLYEIIVRRYNPYLYKVGRSYNYNHQDTQDLMQEAFIDAYKCLRQFESRSQFKTWIIRIMMNRCYRRRLKRSYTNEMNQEINEDSTPLFSGAGKATELLIQNRELGRVIEAALSRIPREYRLVFSLREVTGLNVAETAELMQISPTNVKVRLNRAKAMLRKEIIQLYTPSEIYEFNLIYCDAIVEKVMLGIQDIKP